MSLLQAVGDFEIQTAKVITSAGIEVDLLKNNMVAHIVLYEDTTMSSLSGEILLSDSFAFTNVGPIIGQEYLKLKIKTPSITDKENTIDFIDNVFVVNSLQNRTTVGNSVQTYILNFTTSELAKNQRTKVSRSLKGSYSDIVKEMLKDELDCRKNIYIEPTAGSKRIIAPNARPFDIIRMASREAVSKLVNDKVSSYLFYENIEGYHFRSVGSLYAQGSVQSYTSFIKGANISNGGVDIERELGNVLDFEIISGSNSLVNYTAGVFGSDLIVHNIFNKSIKKHSYGIFENFDKEQHIASYHSKSGKQFPIYSHMAVEDNGKTAQDFRSKIYVAPISQNGVADAQHNTLNDTTPFTPSDPQNWLQFRTSQRVQLEQGFMVNILTHGNTVVKAGNIVKLDLPYDAAFKTEKNEQNDRFFNGAFLVKRLRHDFDFGEKKHKTHMTLVKDSLDETLDGSGNPEPKSGSAKIIDSREELYPRL